jgi:NhaP-type Na+/H+ or K+/H+ antiporter
MLNIGIIFTALSKYLVEMLKSEIAVSAYVLYVGYLSYSISKYLHLPGAVTIFVVGLIFSHYLSYNMPFKCFEASRTSLRFMASCFESFIFVYLGMTFAAMFLSARASEVSISWGFICYEIFVIIIARAVSFYGVIGIILLYHHNTIIGLATKHSKHSS